MRHPKLSAPLAAGALLLSGAAACSADEPAPAEQQLDVDDEDITKGVDPGEEPVLDGDEDP